MLKIKHFYLGNLYSFTSRIVPCAIYEFQINELHTANSYSIYKRNAKRKKILRYLRYFIGKIQNYDAEILSRDLIFQVRNVFRGNLTDC